MPHPDPLTEHAATLTGADTMNEKFLLTALDEFLDTVWMAYGTEATDGIQLTLPHITAQTLFREFPSTGVERHSVTWLSPYGNITIQDADHAAS